MFLFFRRRAAKCLTVFPTHLCVGGWPPAALTDTSGCGTPAPKVPLPTPHLSKPNVILPASPIHHNQSTFSSILYSPFISTVLAFPLPVFNAPLPCRRLSGAAVSDLSHRLGHLGEVGTSTWAPAGLRFPWQPGQTVGHQKVCEALYTSLVESKVC